MWLSKCTFVQISNILSLCSKCPPCAWMQARRRGHHCLTASLMNRCWKSSHSWSGATSAGQRHDSAVVYTLLQLTPNLVVYRVEVRTFSCHRAGVIKSDVRVNSCMVSHWLRQPQCHFRTSDCSTLCKSCSLNEWIYLWVVWRTVCAITVCTL